MEDDVMSDSAPQQAGVTSAQKLSQVRHEALDLFATAPKQDARNTALFGLDSQTKKLSWLVTPNADTKTVIVNAPKGTRAPKGFEALVNNELQASAAKVQNFIVACTGAFQTAAFGAAVRSGASRIFADISDMDDQDMEEACPRDATEVSRFSGATTELVLHTRLSQMPSLTWLIDQMYNLRTLIFGVQDKTLRTADLEMLFSEWLGRIPQTCHLRVVWGGTREFDHVMPNGLTPRNLSMHHNSIASFAVTSRKQHLYLQGDCSMVPYDYVDLGAFCPSHRGTNLVFAPFCAETVSLRLTGEMPQLMEADYALHPPVFRDIDVVFDEGEKRDCLNAWKTLALGLHRLIRFTRSVRSVSLRTTSTISADYQNEIAECMELIAQALWAQRRTLERIDLVFAVPDFNRLLSFDSLVEEIKSTKKAGAREDNGTIYRNRVMYASTPHATGGASARIFVPKKTNGNAIPRAFSVYEKLRVLRIASFDDSLYVGPDDDAHAIDNRVLFDVNSS
jgi:hypothetical protein